MPNLAPTWPRNVPYNKRQEAPRAVKYTVTLVDDDQHILTSVAIALEAEGFAVRGYSDSLKGLNDILDRPPDLAILDIKMPQINGLELLRRLRKHSQIPVVFLTSKDEEADELLGLQVGADDYVKKPFSVRLLIERVRAILRRGDQTRVAEGGPADGTTQEPIVVRGNMVLDPGRHTCTWSGGAVLLTVTEFLLLKALALRPGHVKSRNQLMDAAYDDHIYIDDRTIDSHIKRIRKKFRVVDPNFAQIETLYGVGYRYVQS